MTTVSFFHSEMTGAPTLAGQAGALATLLETCLVNGFGLGTQDSLVVAGGVATVTRAAGHPFEVDAIAEVAGATVTGGTINGRRRVLSRTTNTWTFDATGIPDQTATGTITAKIASAGWAKPYSAGNVAVFRSADVTGTRPYLRVDDTGTFTARVRGYESMTDADTGTGPFPTDAQGSGGGHWCKSDSATTAARKWVLVADSKTFYLAVCWTAPGAHVGDPFSLHCAFGDADSFKPADAYSGFLHCASSNITGSIPGNTTEELDLVYFDVTSAAAYSRTYFARGHAGVGGSIVARRVATLSPPLQVGGQRSGAGGWAYPNGPDGGLYLGRMLFGELSGNALRGAVRGCHWAPQTIGGTSGTPGPFSSRERVTGVTGLTGRSLLSVVSATGVAFFDITGPW